MDMPKSPFAVFDVRSHAQRHRLDFCNALSSDPARGGFLQPRVSMDDNLFLHAVKRPIVLMQCDHVLDRNRGEPIEVF